MASGPPAARLAAVYFAYFAYVGAFSPYFGLYMQSAGATAWQIGIVLGAMQLVRVVAPNLWAAAADRAGRRAGLLALGAVLGTVTFAALFSTTAFAGMLAILVVHAFCTGGITPLLEAITLASLRGQLARYGAIRLWGSVGFIVAVTVVGFQLDRLPIESLLYTVLLTLVGTALAALSLPGVTGAPRAAPVALGPILRDRGLQVLLAACFLMTLAHGPLYAFYSIYLHEHGYSKALIGALWSIGVVAEIAVFWFQPRWASRIRMETVFLASLACGGVRFVLIGVGVEHLAVLVFAQILHGATFGSYHVAALALVHRHFGEGAQVRGQALYTSLSYGAGGVLGAIGSGLLWDAVGAVWTFAAASAVACAGFALAILMQRGARRTMP